MDNVVEDAGYSVNDDVDDDAEEDDGCVEVEFDAVNPDDAGVVLDEAVVADDVYVAVVANLLDDEVVEVDEVDVLGFVVVVNLIDATVEDVVYDDLDVLVVTVVVVSELLIINDDVDDVGIDRLGDVACRMLPVDVVNVLLAVEVVVSDVKVIVFQVVDDNVGDAAVMGKVADNVKDWVCKMVMMTMVMMLAVEVL